MIEFKRFQWDVETAFVRQLKPAMREKDPSDAEVLGVYYDAGRLYLFYRRGGRYLRYDQAKNERGLDSQVGDLSLHLPDAYQFLPSFSELIHRVNRVQQVDRSHRSIGDLDVIPSITTIQMAEALSNVLRAMDKLSLVNQRGYGILIQTFACKIFDEKRNQRSPHMPLRFYITDEERNFHRLAEAPIQGFIQRLKQLQDDATSEYDAILRRVALDWADPEQVRVVVAVCENFQDFSFVRSSKSDLHQLIFYNFADKFQQQEHAQFLTPLEIIDFMVNIVNPRDGESVFDPCCGIGDFLSLSYVHAQDKSDPWKLDDANIYGADISADMIALASLNMLLNGDGRAHLFRVPDKGSITWKISDGSPPEPVELSPSFHKAGKWDRWPDKTRLKKFDVILTNPPFGEDRAYRATTAADRSILEMYGTWEIARSVADQTDAFDAAHLATPNRRSTSKSAEAIDLGVIFLENAYRCLKDEGRMGIVLSNSIASIDRWAKVREWLIARMRIVAIFDLPSNVFGETGVNTTIIIAYKPRESELLRLKELDYSVFARDIHAVGYEKRTYKRNVMFNRLYRIDETTFDVAVDGEGNPIRDEDFGQTVKDFRQWALGQEETLQRLFLREDEVR